MARPNPFPGLNQVSPSTYYYQPSKTSNSASEPRLIILCTWMAAQPTHITKYITGYQTLFPSSKILLIRCEAPDVIYRSSVTLRRRTQPALEILRSLCAREPSRPEILLHIFSNGGSHQATNLLRVVCVQVNSLLRSSVPGSVSLRLAALTLRLPPF